MFLVRATVVFSKQSVEHDRAEAAARHSADGKKVVSEVSICVLKSAQNNSRPVSGSDSTALRCHDVERMGPRKFLDQCVPPVKSGKDSVALERACWNRANAMTAFVPRLS